MLGADFGISHSLLTESTASEIHPTTFDGKVKPNFLYNHEITYQIFWLLQSGQITGQVAISDFWPRKMFLSWNFTSV